MVTSGNHHLFLQKRFKLTGGAETFAYKCTHTHTCSNTHIHQALVFWDKLHYVVFLCISSCVSRQCCVLLRSVRVWTNISPHNECELFYYLFSLNVSYCFYLYIYFIYLNVVFKWWENDEYLCKSGPFLLQCWIIHFHTVLIPFTQHWHCVD